LPANVCTPNHVTSDVTFKATAAVTGKRFVAPSGNRTGGPGLSTDLENVYRMAHCAAGAKAFGVSKYDVALNAEGGAYGTPGRIVPVTCVSAVTAGQQVEVGAAGQAQPWGGTIATQPVGLALSGAAGGADAEIKLY
jgi:hypothetical protein